MSKDYTTPSIDHLLPTMLALAVPLRIMGIIERGGPTREDMQRVQSYQDDLGERGDDLLYPGRQKGATATRFNQVADAIAVLSFCPGGVPAFGMHFDGNAMRAAWEAREHTQAPGAQPPASGE